MNKLIYSLALLIGFFSTKVASGQGTPSDLPASVAANAMTVSPTSTKNYVCTYDYLQAMATHPAALTAGGESVTISYIDGLGRPSQTVSVMGSPAGKDIVNWQTYDAYGRVSTQYVPYTKSTTGNNGSYTIPSTSFTEQTTFLTGIYGDRDGAQGFSVTGYESSPLDRVTSQGAPGEAWQPNAHPVTMAYETNTSAVATWSYSGDTYIAYSFPVNSLYVYKTTDEDGNQAREYKDKEDRLIMKEVYSGTAWIKTRYCYDEFSLLRCVVPPPAYVSVEDPLYCYCYKYDKRKRMIAKRLPGCSWNYMVYDTRDRQVLSQDGVLGTINWNYIVYDVLNRPIETGTYSSSATQTTLTASFASNIDYLAGQTKTPWSYIYYDNYTGLPVGYEPDLSNGSVVNYTDLAASNKGRQTWTKTILLKTETGMNTWLISAVYYDKYGRVIQTVSDNHLGGKDCVSNRYNFIGQVCITTTKHVADGNINSVGKNLYYDHRGRLLKIGYNFQNTTETLLAAYVYDEAGNQKIKYQDSQNNSAFLQKIDYKYNIRGWLTQINDPASFTADNDKFGLKLYYQTPPTGGTACFNGNISGMGWGSVLKPNLLSRFTYDRLNRLTASNYVGTAYVAGAFGTSYSYNDNGFASRITRKNSTAAVIDDLYIGNIGNKISSITWDNGGDYGGSSYVDYPGLSSANNLQFIYENNGNMMYDPYKLMWLSYNRLNLPEVINFGSNKKISYFYTASGQKVRQVVESAGTLTKVDYCGPFVYETIGTTRSLKYLITEEGRVVKNGANWIWEYDQTDHLGDVRTVVRRNATTGLAELVQDNHYFPFGMLMSDISTSSTDNRYRYNGKEYQNDLGFEWYDYGARFYDPALARFHSVDPMAGKRPCESPYCYTGNNPISRIDPTGMIWKDPKDAERLNKTVNNRTENIKNNNTEIQAQIDKGGLSEKKLAKLQNKLADNSTKIGLLNQSLSDIKAIGEAKETYALSSPSQSDGTHGVVKDSKGVIQIEGSNTGLHLHEIRHVGQSIDAGGVKFNKNGQLLNAATTNEGARNNEVNAYQVEYSYDYSYPAGASSLKDINGNTLMNIKKDDGTSVYEQLKDKK